MADIRQKQLATDPDVIGDFLVAHWVTRRCSVLTNPAQKRLVLWIQEMSTRQGCITHPTCPKFAAWPLPFPPSYKGETGLELLALELVTRGGKPANFKNLRAAKDWLIRLALDPDTAPFESPGLFLSIPRPLESLYTIMADCLAAPMVSVAETATQECLWDMLDFCWETRSLGLAVGTYRIGKSHCAQAYAQTRGGHVRYIELTSAPTVDSFFRQIGRAVGVTNSMHSKTGEIGDRISAAVLEANFFLIFDEGQFLLSHHTVRSKQAPQRLSFVMTSLCNRGVPVAIIANRDWPRLVATLKQAVPWFGWEQWTGRVRRNITLPDALSEADLQNVARVIAPEADKPTLTLLAGFALRHSGHIATIEAVVSLARFLAKKEGRPLDFDFCQLAFAEIDPTFSPIFPTRAPRIFRQGAATASRASFDRPNRNTPQIGLSGA